MYRSLLILFISVLFISKAAVAQNSSSELTAITKATATIDGYIKDAETGETLLSANIAFQETNKGNSTNTNGYYSIHNILPGTYTVMCSYIGYESYQETVTVKEGEKLRLDVELEPKDAHLDEIEVQSNAREIARKNIGIAQVDTELIKSLPSVIETDVFRSVQLLPGIKASSDFSSGLHVRGGSPDQTLILLDKTPVYNPNHFFGFLSTFNPDAIQDIRLYKGGYPAEFGGRLGSVLTINNKTGNTDKTTGSITAGMLASRISMEGPFKKGSWMFAARRSTLEPLLDALRKNNEGIPEDFYFYDFNGSVDFNASKKDNISLAFYAGKDWVDFPFAEKSGFHLDYGNQTMSGSWTRLFSDKLYSNFQITGSRYFNYPEFETAGSTIERGNNIYDFSIKWDLEYLANDKHIISGGMWSGITTLKIQDRFDGADTFSSRIHNRYASVYLQDDWRPSDKWKLTPGIRVNYFSNGDYVRMEPRFSAEFIPNDRLRFQASYGHYNQFMTLASNEAYSGFDVWLTSADGVPPSYGDQLVLGLKTIPFQTFGFDVEVYYRTMKDLFELDPFLPDVAGMDYRDMFRTGDGSAYGVEVFFEKRAGKFTGFIGYTLGYTWRKYPGHNIDINSEDATARAYPPKYDRRHDINLVTSYQLTSRWKATASFSYATGQAFTKPLGRYNVRHAPWQNGSKNVFTVGKVNASRLPDYHTLDFALSRKGRFFNIADSELQLQVINVYSRRNVWFYNYYFDADPVEKAEVSMLPVLPSVSFTLKF